MTDSEMHSTNNSSNGDAGSPDESQSALRTVVQLTLRTDLRRILGGCPIEQSGLRENLRAIAAHARRHQLRAEQFLVLIKDVCGSLPEGRELRETPAGPTTLAKVVSIAVDEYYLTPPGPV